MSSIVGSRWPSPAGCAAATDSTSSQWVVKPMGFLRWFTTRGYSCRQRRRGALAWSDPEYGTTGWSLRMREEGPIERAGVESATGKKPPWKQRKVAYLEHLAHAPDDALLVSACDKLHNLRSIVLDLDEVGQAVFDRFTATREQTVWYYGELVGVLAPKVPEMLAGALVQSLAELREKAGSPAMS